MNTTKEQSLLSPDKQAVQRGRITEKVLSFLLIETFTSTEVFQEYLEYSSRLGCHKSLRRLQKIGYITEYDLDTLAGRKIKLWGITSKGIYAVSDPEITTPKIKTFNTSKISLLTLPHRLKSHKIAIQAIKNGYNLENGSIIFKSYGKIPDIILSNPRTNEFTSLEIELSVKTVSRYEKIIEAYSKPLKYKVIKTVIWIVPDEKIKNRLKKIFNLFSSPSLESHKVVTISEYHLPAVIP